MSKAPSRTTVTTSPFPGATGKSWLIALWDALRCLGWTDVDRVTVNASATLLTTQCGILLVDCSAGSVTLTLPTSGTTTDEADYRIRRIDAGNANTLTVQRGGTDLIEGGTSSVTIGSGGQVDFKMPAGANNWRVVGRGGGTQQAALSTLGASPILQSYIAGLIPSTIGSSAVITTSAGQAVDSTNSDVMTLAASMSKTTSAWTVGSGNGGLDTGVIANSTKYYVWLIKRPDTGAVDVLLSLSATAPTMPANYTLKRLIGFGATNGSGQWTLFKAFETAGGGLHYQWAAPTVDFSSAAVTTSRSTATLTTPALSVLAELRCVMLPTAACDVTISSPDETDGVPSTGFSPGSDSESASGVLVVFNKVIQTSATGTVAVRSTQAGTTVRLFTQAFTWSRR